MSPLVRGRRAADEETVDALRGAARPLRIDADLDPLIERIGDARVVLLGEASHGTAEYYDWRRRISERLILEKGFSFLAVEGDWPDCERVNRYVRGLDGRPGDAETVLAAFTRWPTWMWANREVAALAERLRTINDGRPPERRVGFHGLDVYSLWDSLHAAAEYARREAPDAVEAACAAYRCFEPFGDVADYARAASWGFGSCEDAVVRLLGELRERRCGVIGGRGGADENWTAFDAEQNALVARDAERYYRTMVRGGGASWNVRDRHMDATLDRLMTHYDRTAGPAKAVVWEHNTHVGDARATDMARAGMVNVGQLARERYGGRDCVIVGFGSHRGGVVAGDRWDAPRRRMAVPDARPGSWEDLMHRAFDGGDRLLIFPPGKDERNAGALRERRGHRAIGVVYDPDNEAGNYVPTALADRYDAFLYLDRTSPLHPLDAASGAPADEHDLPETYPSGV